MRGRITTSSKVWFVWMVGMWTAFFALLRTDRLDARRSHRRLIAHRLWPPYRIRISV
ncbi:hypothetical protein AB0F43_20785 [Kribbella sp. NPDC023972]|uniref:hypothetical protein n=1 Tax=Kribbella sp. NPDC023972 TaxID=3154795 RepID=UPI0033D8B97C